MQLLLKKNLQICDSQRAQNPDQTNKQTSKQTINYNQDLNLTKQKYEILTGHIRIVANNFIK